MLKIKLQLTKDMFIINITLIIIKYNEPTEQKD
jgi:hypothetical protein